MHLSLKILIYAITQELKTNYLLPPGIQNNILHIQKIIFFIRSFHVKNNIFNMMQEKTNKMAKNMLAEIQLTI